MKAFPTGVLVLLAACLCCEAQVKTDSSARPSAPPAQLARNVRIDFKLLPEEDDAHPLFVVTAVPAYVTRIAFSNNDTEFEVDVSGEVTIRDDGKVHVSFNATLRFDGNDGEARMEALGAVVVGPGEELAAASMGERTLYVRVDFVDAVPVRGLE
jgi:hypothetical protein